MQTDIAYMQRALQLAALGRGRTSPNPLVGCVVVYQDRIIGEGYHQQYGGPHAEVNALSSVRPEDMPLLAHSTLYVTLEPCSHFGKTPPCADLIVRHGLQRVVVCNGDPNPLVAGRGLQRLQDAGIAVTEGVLAQEGEKLNARFFTFMRQQRPYVILKWAQTADGFVARSNYDSKWISNALSRKLVHKWRAEEDAILVGRMTALHDDPALTVRDWRGKHPLRVVIDRGLQLPPSLSLFDGSTPTLCYNLLKEEENPGLTFAKLPEGAQLSALLSDLHARKVQSLIVEGGSQTLQAFIDAGLWDEARVFTATTTFGQGIAAPKLTDATYAGQLALLGDRCTFFRRADDTIGHTDPQGDR